MQVAGSAYPSSQPLYPYPTHYHQHHHPIPVAHDHELKRQYLTLLPPQQIIEICLTFDVHVPPYVKASIWPIDINAAIGGLRKQAAAPSDKDGKAPKNSSDSTAVEDTVAIMDSLTASSSEPSPAPDSEKSKELVEEPRPPDKEPFEEPKATTEAQDSPSPESTTDVHEEPESETSNATATPAPTTNPPSTGETAPAPNSVAPQPMPVAYPHQPYGYPYAPYYPPPPPGYPYPHPHQYPAYPHHQPQHAYPPPPPPPSMQPVPPPPAPPMPTMQDGQSPDDLPSYEEMIVEALMDTNDSEGCAPKDLFTWMASRYPVQSNFRPSASQALQKAYKRGRLEKSSNNKYRINAAWEGGNTSRRTTRRPQTQTHTITPSNQPSSSPFTNAPLHHQHQPQQHQPYGGHPYSSYPYPQPAYPSYPAPPVPAPQPPPAPAPASSTAPEPKSTDAPDKEVTDAYEAAQSILKAINFGSLLQLPAGETQEGVAARDTQSYHHANTAVRPPTLLAALNGAQPLAVPVPAARSVGDSSNNDSRAELQAHLALLAAQLAELARVDDTPVLSKEAQAPQTSISVPIIRSQEVQDGFSHHHNHQASTQQAQAALYPYPLFLQPQAQTQQHQTQHQPQQAQPPAVNTLPMASLQPPELEPRPQLELQHAPSPPPAPPTLVDESPSSPGLDQNEQMEPMDYSPDGEYESDDDDDMEEVI